MDWIESAPIDSAIELPQAARDALGTTLESLLFRELFEFHLMQSDPNPANYRIDVQGRVVLLDWHGLATRRPELLYADGVHLRPEGAAAFARMVARAIKEAPARPAEA